MKISNNIVYIVAILAVTTVLINLINTQECGRDKDICPDGTTAYSERCPEEHYLEYERSTRLGLSVNLMDEEGNPIFKIDSANVSSNYKLITESYNQYTALLFQSLRGAYFNANRKPCDSEYANRLAMITEKIIEQAARGNEILYKYKNDSLSKGYIQNVVGKIDSSKLQIEEHLPALVGNNNQHFIALYGYKSNSTKFKYIEEYLDERYNVLVSSNLEVKPEWFASSSAVMYYDKTTKEEAEKLADKLRDLSGLKFDVFMGAGLGVTEQNKPKSFRVHMY